MTEPNAALVGALEHFLQQAKEAVDEEVNRDGPLPLTPMLLAERLKKLPACREADAAAHRAAIDNEYAVTSLPRRRRSSEPAITTTTIAGAGAGAGVGAGGVPHSLRSKMMRNPTADPLTLTCSSQPGSWVCCRAACRTTSTRWPKN